MLFRRNIPVLCYHGTSAHDGMDPDLFARHLDTILDMGFTTIPARTLWEIATGRAPARDKDRKKPIVLTFDDCLVSNWLTAAPLLAERGMTGAFFAVTDFIGDGPVRTGGTAPKPRSTEETFRAALEEGDFSGFMNRAELLALVHDLGMEVHSHSSRHQGCFATLREEPPHWAASGIHPPGSDLPHFRVKSGYAYNGFWPVDRNGETIFVRRTPERRRQDCLEDFTRSLAAVREINQADVQLFCWPWGHFDAYSEAALKQAGFQGAFTLERGFNGPGTNPFRINRIGVAKNQPESWLKSRLRLYGREAAARILVKRFRKEPEMNRVLYLTDSGKLSGGSRQLLNNALAMQEHGMEVIVSAPEDSPVLREAVEHELTILPNMGLSSYQSAARFTARAVQDCQIDILHTFHNRAVKAASLARLLLKLTRGPDFRLFFNRGVVYKPNTLAPLWARIGDGYICNSRACLEVLAEHRVPKNRLNLVYNSFAAKLPPRSDLSGNRVLYLGNTHPAKGMDVFLDMIRSYKGLSNAPRAEFAAIGARFLDKYAKPFHDVLHDLDNLGHLDHAQVLEELSRASVLVLSSRQESMPNALLEGFAAGVPVVCTRAGGMPELVKSVINGFVCPSEDALCLAERVARLLADEGLRSRMGERNLGLTLGPLNNRIKGERLLQVYSGQILQDPLPLGELETVRENGHG